MRVGAKQPHLQESWTTHGPMDTGWIVVFILIESSGERFSLSARPGCNEM